MPTPFAPRIIVSQHARTELHALARAHATPPSLALRARRVLRAADLDRPSHRAISRALGCDHHTAGQWRQRYLDLGILGLQEAVRSGRPKALAAPTRVHGISVASPLPHAQGRPVTRWTLGEIAATVGATRPTEPLSRASLWRILQAVALKAPKRAYWLHSHDEDCEATAHTLCQRYVKALEAYAQGRLGSCCDAKTGRPVLERTAPTKPAPPGRRERRAHEDMRHGTRVLLNALAVATGQLAWTIGATRTATEVVAHLQHASQHLPRMQRYAGGLDNLPTPGSLDVCRLVAQGCQGPFAPAKRKKGVQRRAFLSDPSHRHSLHGTPQHGSWLHQAALFFGTLPRRCLARGSVRSLKDFERRFEDFLKDYHTRQAHPYRWTYTGEPLVRDTPFRRTRRQPRQGRACFRPRPKRFERLFYAPRPSRRQAA
jgi:transposase